MTLLIGRRYRPELAESLAAQGIEVFWLPDDPTLDDRLAGHADLMVFAAGGQALVSEGIAGACGIVNYLTNRGYTVRSFHRQGPGYPHDAALCLCDTGKFLIYNSETAAPTAAALAGGRVPVPVRQGYAKCAACVVDDHSIITADAGVSRAAKSAGMDVLDITPGYIQLDGFREGFIGGASFIIRDDAIAFTGTLDAHPDKGRILGFLAKHGKEPVILTDRPIFDIGGAIPV